MKKKLLLTFLPAVLVLSACGGRALQNNPNNNNGAIEAEDIFEEDTLAHEEIFGGEAVSYKLGQPEGLQPRRGFLDRNLDAVDPMETPSIGVQYLQYHDDGAGLVPVPVHAVTVGVQGCIILEGRDAGVKLQRQAVAHHLRAGLQGAHEHEGEWYHGKNGKQDHQRSGKHTECGPFFAFYLIRSHVNPPS